jgi:putative Ca2+/H+ antiporter (TMEM165/GDT1 family)
MMPLPYLLNSLNSVNLANVYHTVLQQLQTLLNFGSLPELSATTVTSFALIFAAEFGDKSQFVCMILASRYRAWPVFFGAVAAFSLLNTLAVIFGALLAHNLPEPLIAGIVSLLFAIFGLHALRIKAEDEDDSLPEKNGSHLFFTTFLLITVAEFGDKTQLAVVALSSAAAPLAVWLGSTVALASTSALGIIAGRSLLKKIPLVLLHKISGSLFLILAAIAAYRCAQDLI